MDRPLPGGGSGTGPDQDETVDAAVGPGARRSPIPADDADEPALVDPRRYQRGQVVAKGGMGQIVEARDRRLGRVVAIKELLPGRGDARGLFEAEARITARLSHPAIVPVHDAGRWPSGEPFYAMKLVEGRSLEQALRAREALPERLRLLPSVATVADALAYAHSRRIIHRDLKPANILLGEYGETVVIDWGLARDLDEAGGDERVVGTPAYMAPEQARGEPLDERSDVYALGAVLYSVIAGAPPYRERDGRDVIEQLVSGRTPPPDLRPLGCPDDLWAIIAKAMARAPGDRYPSAARLAEDLRRFLDGRLIGARRYTRRERLLRWARRHLAIVVTASLAAIILIVGGALSLSRILAEKAAAVAAHHEAVEQREVAELGNAALHEEAGRRELLAGRSGPALAHFLVARQRGRESRALDFLVEDAARAFTSQELSLPLAGRVLAVGFSADARHVLGADDQGHLRVFSVSSGSLEWSEDVGSAVLAAAWAPEENRLAVAVADGRVTVYGLADPKPLVVRAAGAPVGVLAWRPGGLAFGDAAGGLVVVDLDEGGVHERARAQLGTRLDALAVSGGLVAAGGEDGSVNLVTTGAPRRLFVDERHRGVTALGFDPAGRRLVVAGQDGLAVILDSKSGAVVATLSGLRSDVRRAAFEPVRGEEVLTAGADGLAALWSGGGEKLHELVGHGDALTDAGFSLDGRYVVSAGGDGSARVWEVASGEEMARFEGHSGGVRRVGVDPNVRRVVTGGDDGTVRTFTLATGLVATLPRDAEIGALTWLADGSLVTAAAREAWRHDVDERITRERFTAHADSVVTLAHDARGAHVASGGLDGSILVHPTGGGAPERRELGAPVFAVALSPSGRWLAAGGDGRLRWWDRVAGGPPHDEPVAGEVNALAFLDDDRLLVASGNRARLRRLPGGEALWESPAQPADVNAVAVDARHGRVASASGSSVTVWSPDGAGGLATSAYLVGGRGRVTALDFSADGERLAVATQDGTLDVWSPDEGGRLLWRRHRPGALWSVGWAADAKRLAAGGDDQEVWVWNVDAPASTPGGLARLVVERVPWRIVDDRLAPYGESKP